MEPVLSESKPTAVVCQALCWARESLLGVDQSPGLCAEAEKQSKRVGGVDTVWGKSRDHETLPNFP